VHASLEQVQADRTRSPDSPALEAFIF
jgi:hypothetical protein